MNPNNLTDDQLAVVTKGDRAEFLLNNETFQAAINELSEDLANQMLSTKPDEEKLRNNLYFMHKALEGLVAILRDAINQRMLVLHEVAEAEERHRQEKLGE